MTALIGGVAGGFLALLIAIMAIFCLVRKIQKNSTPGNSPCNSRPTSQQEPTEMTTVSTIPFIRCIVNYSFWHLSYKMRFNQYCKIMQQGDVGLYGPPVLQAKVMHHICIFLNFSSFQASQKVLWRYSKEPLPILCRTVAGSSLGIGLTYRSSWVLEHLVLWWGLRPQASKVVLALLKWQSKLSKVCKRGKCSSYLFFCRIVNETPDCPSITLKWLNRMCF